MHSSIKLVDLWIAGFFVFSGYLVPLSLFPSWVQKLPHFLPFAYQLSVPVEMIIGKHDAWTALHLLMKQWMVVVALFVCAVVLWRRGIKRYGAFGG